MNRRTFLQALSLATAAAVVPAVAEAQTVVPYGHRLAPFWQAACDEVQRHRGVCIIAHQDRETWHFLRHPTRDVYELRLGRGSGRARTLVVAELTAKRVREGDVAGWRDEVRRACEALVCRTSRAKTRRGLRSVWMHDTDWVDVGATYELSDGESGFVVSVNRDTGEVEYEALS